MGQWTSRFDNPLTVTGLIGIPFNAWGKGAAALPYLYMWTADLLAPEIVGLGNLDRNLNAIYHPVCPDIVPDI